MEIGELPYQDDIPSGLLLVSQAGSSKSVVYLLDLDESKAPDTWAGTETWYLR